MDDNPGNCHRVSMSDTSSALKEERAASPDAHARCADLQTSPVHVAIANLRETPI